MRDFFSTGRILLYILHINIFIFGGVHNPDKLVQKCEVADVEEVSPPVY